MSFVDFVHGERGRFDVERLDIAALCEVSADRGQVSFRVVLYAETTGEHAQLVCEERAVAVETEPDGGAAEPVRGAAAEVVPSHIGCGEGGAVRDVSGGVFEFAGAWGVPWQ